MKRYLLAIDTATSGNRNDVTPLFANATAFRELTQGLEFVDYSGDHKRLELRSGILEPGARALLVDDWIETGAQVRTAIRLLESVGAEVVGVAAIKMDRNEVTDEIARRYPVHTVWDT